MLHLISAEQADQLNPEQWVNVYELEGKQAIYYETCQVQNLELEEPEFYGLELVEDKN
jgi:hypothetical protein